MTDRPRKGITLDEWGNRVRLFNGQCWDDFSDTRTMAVSEEDFKFHYEDKQEAESADALFKGTMVSQDEAFLTDHAFTQINARLNGPPLRWMAHPSKVPVDLRAKILNTLLQYRENKRVMLRRRGEDVRAILSESYTPFDHVQLLDLIQNAIEAMGVVGDSALVLRSHEIKDELRAYILFPAIRFGDDPIEGAAGAIRGGTDAAFDAPDAQMGHRFWDGDGGLHPGCYVSNSEIGTGKVRIHGGIWRGYCQNGVIVGWKEEEAFAYIHRGLQKETLQALVADGLTHALKMSEAATRQFLDAQAVFLKPGKSLEALCNSWGDKYGLQLSSKEAWNTLVGAEASMYNRRNTPTLFDAVNAATSAAHDLQATERELVERMAGDLLMEGVDYAYVDSTLATAVSNA